MRSFHCQNSVVCMLNQITMDSGCLHLRTWLRSLTECLAYSLRIRLMPFFHRGRSYPRFSSYDRLIAKHQCMGTQPAHVHLHLVYHSSAAATCGDLCRGCPGSGLRCPSLLPLAWINRGQCMGVRVRQGNHTHTQPRADSAGIIRNIWDHLQREHELWWDPDALLGFTKNTGTLIYEGPLLAPHPGRCVSECVCVCVLAG